MEGSIDRIVFGTAEHQDEDPRLASVVRLADSIGATLYVVHGFRLPDPVLYPLPSVSVFDPDLVRQIAEGVQAQLEAQVHRLSASERIYCRAVAGPPDMALLEVAEAEGADLIVVGATRRGAIGRALLGTTAQRVVRGSSVPVLVLRHAESGPWRRVLLTTDLSELSATAYKRALQVVSELSAQEEREVRTVLVIGYEILPPPPLSEASMKETEEVELERFLQRVGSEDSVTQSVIRTGEPAAEIVTEATDWGADLVALGTRGRGRTERFLIGSVAESVLKSAPCDVLVVPPAERD
jgi:nucleotide-binding universal stress UspA family protein